MKTFDDILKTLKQPATFFFVRHGESAGNVAGKMQGVQDEPLTALGREQADATGAWFAAEQIAVDRLFASPLSRAMETGERIAAAARYPQPEPLPAAQELNTGIFTGLSFPQIQERFPHEYSQFMVDSWEAVPEAETVRELLTRALQVWEAMVTAANAGAERVMTITHGGMVQWILKASFGAHPDAPVPWMPLILASNCAIFEFTARPVRRTDEDGAVIAWYYGQWSRMNHAPAMDSSPGAIAREQFHTSRDAAGDVAR
jgi:broad specificity phosphatase PhoE